MSGAGSGHQCGSPIVRCPYGVPGDVLWVKETWRLPDSFDRDSPTKAKARVRSDMAPNVFYEADGSVRTAGNHTGVPGKTRVSIHMPRWASRISLRITDVRVERLNDISEADALAEGIEFVTRTASGDFYRNFRVPNCPLLPCGAYRSLWEYINGQESWTANPWVWVIVFERVT